VVVTRSALAWLITGLTGCHLLSGYDDLQLREDPEGLWSRAFGDPLGEMEPHAQVAQDVTARNLDTYIAGELEGTMPIGEDLVSHGGKDVFVTALDDRGDVRWTKRFGEANDERVRSIITTDDSVIAMGTFSGNLPVDGETLMAPLGESFFIAEFAHADGAMVRARQSTGALELIDVKVDMAIDRDDQNLVVVGGFGGSLAFSPCESLDAVGAMDIFVAKLSDTGCLWSKRFGDDLQAAESVGVGGSGIVVAGEFVGTLAFDPQNALQSGGGIDIFLVKLSTDGESVLWQKQFGDPGGGIQSSVRVAVQQFGSVVLAGYFKGTLDFGGGPMSSSVGHDLFVAKFDPKGDYLWSKHFPTERKECTADDCNLDRIALVADGEGDIVLSGHFQGAVDFGGTALTSNGGTDLFVAKLKSEDGSLLWSGSYGDEKSQCAELECLVSGTIDAAGNVVLAGYFDNTIDFGFGTHKSVGAHDVFVVKMLP
jgi:hypothetical protein